MSRLAFSAGKAVLAMVAVCLLPPGCNRPQPEPVAPKQQATWQSLTLPEQGCSIAFPIEPDRNSTGAGKLGKNIGVRFEGIDYSLFYVPDPLPHSAPGFDPREFMLDGIQSMAGELKKQVVSTEKIERSGHAGMAATLRAPDRDSETRIQWYQARGWLICLIVTGRKEALNDDNAGRFFASLRFGNSQPGAKSNSPKRDH